MSFGADSSPVADEEKPEENLYSTQVSLLSPAQPETSSPGADLPEAVDVPHTTDIIGAHEENEPERALGVVQYPVAPEQELADTVEYGTEEPLIPRSLSANRPLIVVMISTVIAALVMMAVIRWIQESKPSETSSSSAPPPAATSPSFSGVQEPAPTNEIETPLQVALSFDRDCWVEAVVDGRNRFSELRVQGESFTIEAKEKILLTLGNPRSVSIEVNGLPLKLPKLEGEAPILRDFEINLETVRKLRAGSTTH